MKYGDRYDNKDKIISDLIIVEVLNLLNTRLKVNMELTEKIYNFIINELIVLHDEKYYSRGFQHLKSYYPERLPFNDCVYIALMEDLGIKEIATFDKHFNNIEGILRIP